MKNIKGMDVVVYCRYLFSIPVLGYITDVSDHDGAYEVSFYSNNQGGANVTKHNGKFFLPEQCKIREFKEECPTKNSDPLSRQVEGCTKGHKGDSGKTRLDLIPPEALELIGQAFTHGGIEYGDHNWRRGINFSRLYAATQRHLNAFWKGEDIDKDSGLPHLALAGAEICMLVASEERYDDRYLKPQREET